MTSLWKRVRMLASVKAGNVVSRAENPSVLVAEAEAEIRHARDQVWHQLQVSLAAEMKFKAEIRDNAKKAAAWKERARGYVAAQDDRAAVNALQQAHIYEWTSAAMEEHLDEMREMNENLQMQYVDLENQVHLVSLMASVEATRYEQALGAQRSAEARFGTSKSPSDSVYAQLDDARRKANDTLANASALAQMGQLAPAGPDVVMPDFSLVAQKEIAAMRQSTSPPGEIASQSDDPPELSERSTVAPEVP